VTKGWFAITIWAMIKTMVLSTAFVAMASSAFASDTPSTPNMLAVAARQAALLKDSDRPFVMDVDFTLQLDPPTQGHLRLRWEAKDRWWSKVSMGKFEQVKFQKGELTYTLRNVDFTPIQVSDLMGLLHMGEGYDKYLTQADKQHTEGGVSLDCLEAQNPDPKFKREHREVCVDSTTHDIMTDTKKEWGYASDELIQQQFSDFVDFGGHRYPRKFESLKDGRPVIFAHVTGLQESPLDPKLLVPPAGAIERRECPDKKAPEVLEQAHPNYNPHIHGPSETDVQVTIQTDGSVGDAQIVGLVGPAQNEAVMEAVKKSKFKPAMCGTDQVVADMYMVFRFETPFIR
jgi:hypothetical protein